MSVTYWEMGMCADYIIGKRAVIIQRDITMITQRTELLCNRFISVLN